MRAIRRAWVVLLLAVIGQVGALLTGHAVLSFLTYVLAGALLLSALWVWAATRGLRLGRYTRAHHSYVGRPLDENFSLRNTSRLPKPWVVVEDNSDLPGHQAGRVLRNLGAHRQYDWTVRTICQRRGRFRLGPVAISSTDPLGLFEFRREFPQTAAVVVYPATVPLRSFPQPMGYLPGGNALRRRTHHVTTNASGVRDYVPGDSFNRIHWPSTARKGQLISKEFELDPMSDMWIFLDMQRNVHVKLPEDEALLIARKRASVWAPTDELQLEPSTEEYAVTAAASVAEYSIRNKLAVGLVAYGQRREVIQADQDDRQLGKILETLAALHAEGEIPFSQVLSVEAGRLVRGATVVAITPSVQQDWVQTALFLGRAGIRFVTILVDPLGFGGRFSASELLERLLGIGTPTIVLHRGDPLTRVLNDLPPMVNVPVRPLAYVVRR